MHVNFLRLLLLLLGFSYVLSISAVPATRTQNLNTQDVPVLPCLTRMDTVKLEVDEEFAERRMALETQDYGGTGANTHHDPTIPGRL